MFVLLDETTLQRACRRGDRAKSRLFLGRFALSDGGVGCALSSAWTAARGAGQRRHAAPTGARAS
jgi:hypothetical protein